MKILMASGGSGGHIYPSLALAEYLKKDDVYFIGYNNHMEDRIINKDNFEFIGIDKRKGKYKSLWMEYRSIKKKIEELNPDLVIGWGNSLSFLSVLAAKRLGIKTIIHEQNIIPGKANKYSSYFVDDVVTSFEESNKYFKKSITLGNPRGEYVLLNSGQKYKLKKDKLNILVVMGSLGSSTVYSFIMDFINTVKVDARFIISMGKNVRNNVDINNVNEVIVYDYIDSMGDMLKEVDLVISRAGATTISELLSLNVVSILIPSPYVASNHQYYNAKMLVDNGLALMIEEKKLDKNRLKNLIDNRSMQLDIKMNLLKTKKKKGISDFIKLIDEKYRM